MGVFSTIGAVFAGSSGTVFMFIVLAVSDHLWGENVFNCPCGDYRILYTSAFLVVPPVVIIFIDTSWRVLFGTCQMCCDECSSGGGTLNGNDNSNNIKNTTTTTCRRRCCCRRNTCETLVRLLIRPVIIALLWLAFSCMEPKFGRCMVKEVSCTCTQKEVDEKGCTEEVKRKTALMRVAMATLCLGLTCLAFVLAMVYVVFKTCLRCYRRSCCRLCCRRGKYRLIEDGEDYDKTRVLCQCLYTFGVEPKTVIRLQEEKLLCERRLVHLSDCSLRDMGRAIGLGQLEVLREHRKNIRLARWMLDQNYTSESIRTIVEQENLLDSTILDTLRDSLNATDKVKEETGQQLVEVLHQKGLERLLPAPLDPTHHLNIQDHDPEDFVLARHVGVRG